MKKYVSPEIEKVSLESAAPIAYGDETLDFSMATSARIPGQP